MNCERCKKELAELSVSPDAYARKFTIKLNEAILELREIEDPTEQVSAFMVNVDDFARPQAKHNNMTLAEYYRMWANIKEKQGE